MPGTLPPTEQFVDRSITPDVVGFLHRPAAVPSDALVLTHGAGSNCRSPLLIALAGAFAQAGTLTLRCDLPYRQDSPQGPPRPGSAERDREGLRNAVAAVRAIVPGRIFLGGHSYGGRQASLLAASLPDLLDGLLLLSYPLHPPRKPQQLRVDHFPDIRTPVLFVHGTRDPFGSEEEIIDALPLIPARNDLMQIPNTGHELSAKGSSASALCENIAQRFLSFLERR